MAFYEPEPPVTPPEPRYYAHCCECGAGIFKGEPSFVWDGRMCETCAFKRVKSEMTIDEFRAMLDRLEEVFGFFSERETEA